MSAPQLHISPSLALPIDFATDTNGVLAKKGSGKSNAAVVLAEEFHDANIPWIAIDPKGDWHGVRSSEDGKKPGLAVPVFGGKHGDLPLEPTAGALAADLILGDEDRGYLSCVLDVSQFTISDQRRFLLAFGERLYRQKDEERVLHLFLEEAHEYLPQSVPRESTQLVSTWQRIVKLGRTKGLGVTLVSQRSAALNKDVLTQVDNLIVLRTLSPQDRAVVKSWLEVHVGVTEVIHTLHELAKGEAWLWAPDRFPAPVRFQFRRRRTFDSGATPEVGKTRRAPATIADVDLAEIKEQMAESIERAKADDPKELRKTIQRLEREASEFRASIERGKSEPVEPVVERVEVPVLLEGDTVRLTHVANSAFEAMQLLGSVLEEMRSKLEQLHSGTPASVPTTTRSVGRSREGRVPTGPTAVQEPTRASVPVRPTLEVGHISRPQQALLDALAWLQTVRIDQAARSTLAFLAGSSSKSSGFEKNLSTLRTAGLIDYPSQGYVALTDAGTAVAETPSAPLTDDELQQAIYRKLSRPQAELLRVLVEAHPTALDREELAARAGVSAASSGFEKNVSTLRTFGFVDYPARGSVAASTVMFVEGRR